MNQKIYVDNSINNNSKLKLEENKFRICKKEKDKNIKCKLLKNRPEKRNKDRRNNRLECNSNLDNKCYKNSPDKINFNK